MMLAALQADRARVAELQSQIAQLERAISQLRLEQSKVQQRLDSYKYPVLTLPSELVSEIFVRVLPPYPDLPQPVDQSSPTTLTQICQRWREIALGTPALWSAISSFDFDEERELGIFKLWLQRSRHCPLSIQLGTDRNWASKELVEAVVPHRARWQNLKIDVEVENLRVFDGPMPLLRRLELLVGTGLVASGLVADIARHELPLLCTLVLKNAAALQLTFPWTQLTSLTLFAIRPVECVPILVQTRNLVHCKLEVYREDPSSAGPRRDIPLPFLQSLTLIDSRTPAKDFFQNLIIPALRSLKIPERFLFPNPIESLAAFVSRSGTRLDELHLTVKTSVSDSEYHRSGFPSLGQLSFEIVDDDDGFFGF
ncbi:hypothetical protein DFH06DRAFT_1225418 [Mycena polygramma]|nr:hypothetical protein DFH06DRAFT_1225418 [Mycena polygramma]